jgi:hypothetical protein
VSAGADPGPHGPNGWTCRPEVVTEGDTVEHGGTPAGPPSPRRHRARVAHPRHARRSSLGGGA